MSKQKILIVDDDANNRMVVVKALLQYPDNYQSLIACDGEMALKIAEETIPHLILLDWEMPKMNGIETLRKLKEQPATRQIPVIMYTGIMTSSEALQVAIETGAIDFLRKPVEAVELMARIKGILRLQASIQTRVQIEKDKAALIKELQEKELAYKTKELAGLVTQIEQNNSFLDNIYNELETLSSSAKENPFNPKLKKLTRQIKKQTNNEQHWEMLKSRMEHIHGDFLNRLSRKHPSLSKGELKFCAFIRLGLIRKDIATILGISTDSVQKKHSRLRKKIDLHSSSLEVYLQKF